MVYNIFMIKETPKPIFGPDHSEKRGGFGVDSGFAPRGEGIARESEHIPFDDDEHLIKTAENAAAPAAQDSTPAVESEKTAAPTEVLQSAAPVAPGDWIEQQVVHSDGVDPADAAEVVNKLNNLLETTQN